MTASKSKIGVTEQADLFSSAPGVAKANQPRVPTPSRVPLPRHPRLQARLAAASDPFGAEDDEIDMSAELGELLADPPVVPEGPVVYSVSEISSELRDALRDRFGAILIQGEVADYKGTHRSGHLYFGLKDDKSQIRAVMWKGALQKVPFDIKAGLEVIVTGKLDYYPGSGSLQVIVERMEPVGMGALQLKLEQLREKLKAEGLFDASRKRVVRPLNWRIGIVTSKTTAALQDMLRIFKSRFPLVEVFLFHAAVQGEKAPSEVCSGIERANRYSLKAARPLDVLIVTRGGGSYEDLFCFNDESIVRAIAGSKIPTVSAIGHEIDTTLADHVADKRSATPSHAAQETVPEAALWLQRLSELEGIFERRALNAISDYRQRTDTLYSRLVAAAPQKKLEMQRGLLREKEMRLQNLMLQGIERRRALLARLSGVLDALSPLKVLDRGYAVAKNRTGGSAVKSVRDVKSGDEVEILLSDGSVAAIIQ